MSEVYVGQIVMAGFDFAQRDFAKCDGQLMPVNQHQALFALLGTKYGGNGTSTFGLPDLRGSTPVGAGVSADQAWTPTPYKMGDRAGLENVLLTALPAHTHGLRASSNKTGGGRSPVNGVYGNSGNEAIYADAASAKVTLAAETLAAVGGTPHDNMQPYQVLNFAIALKGIFPSRG